MRKALVSLVLLALAASAWFAFQRIRDEKPAPYRTAPVERGDISETVTATGTINAVTTVQVGSQVSGTVDRLHADFNSRVRRGQVIARIDPSRFRADLAQAHGTLANAEAQVERARIVLSDAERTLSRMRELAGEGFVPRSDLDAAQTARDGAFASLRSAEGALAQARGTLSSAETNLRYTEIHSPVDGIVISRNVDVGQTVAASFQTPTLFTIAQDLTRMQVDVGVDEADIGKVRVGQEVSFTVDAWPERTFPGRVSQVRYAPTVTQNVVTYNVVVRVDNPDLLLRPGMTANVSIRIRSVRGVLRVPNAALRFRPSEGKDARDDASVSARKRPASREGSVVHVLDRKGWPQAVPVEIGITDGSFTEVTKGQLAEGTRVVTGESRPAARKNSVGGPPGMGGFR